MCWGEFWYDKVVQPKQAHVSNDASFAVVLWISSMGPFDKGLVARSKVPWVW